MTRRLLCGIDFDMSTANEKEIGNFESIADHWWDVNGPLKPLHKLNPVRISYLKQRICTHFDRDYDGYTPFEGLSILDIGCGGGLVSEPMVRLGGTVTGIDAGTKAIETAQAHADDSGLNITYLQQTAENHEGTYDVVLALEIIEHVDDVPLFIEQALKHVKKDGLIIFSTLNKTPKSFALGIVAAEYILRWLPRGTHDWHKFIKPSSLAAHLKNKGFHPDNITGLIYNPLTDQFLLSPKDIAMNYFMTASRKK